MPKEKDSLKKGKRGKRGKRKNCTAFWEAEAKRKIAQQKQDSEFRETQRSEIVPFPYFPLSNSNNYLLNPFKEKKSREEGQNKENTQEQPAPELTLNETRLAEEMDQLEKGIQLYKSKCF